MVEIVETLEAKLKRHEDALALCMVEIQKLRAENAALKANATAHQTLKNIYGDDSQPVSARVRAAQAALAHESPPLKPVEAPLDLVAEEIEPIADVVARQRARADRMLLEDPAFVAVRNFRAISLKGNGADDGSDDSND
jgi:FtsZ-binding cell division protein ZapB